MKLSTRDAAAFLKKPKPGTAMVLLYGEDAMRTAITRQDLMLTLLGKTAEQDMRLTRMTTAELRSEPARLQDALKAIGFFPGERGVLITDGNDNLAPVLTDALQAWEDGDATIVVEAGMLRKTSKLRKLAETAPNAAAIPLYADPPSHADVEDAMAKAGLSGADREATNAVFELATALDPGDFRQFLGKLSTYMVSADSALSVADVEACAPASTEAGIDTAINAVADGNVAAIGPNLQRLTAQGTNPTTLCIAATRHFKALHAASSHPNGADTGMNALRPPIFGPRRTTMTRQAKNLGMYKLETALKVLLDTDLGLRSASSHPQMAVMERAFIRIAMLARNR